MASEIPLDAYIEASIDDFDDKRDHNWDDPKEGALINKFCDQVAELFVGPAITLLSQEDQTFLRSGMDELGERFGLKDELVEALQIKLAWRFLPQTSAMATRCLELVRLTLQIAPGDQVQRFLAQVGRAYILGLDATVAVMCRGAVENALLERYRVAEVPVPSDELRPCPNCGHRAGGGYSSFNLKAEKAVEHGWLDEELAKGAKEVWTRGSHNAHRDPTLEKKRLEIVTMAVTVLSRLYGRHQDTDWGPSPLGG